MYVRNCADFSDQFRQRLLRGCQKKKTRFGRKCGKRIGKNFALHSPCKTFCGFFTFTDHRNDRITGPVEKKCKRASDFSCSDDTDRDAVMESRHLQFLNKSCGEISDDTGSISGCVAGITIMEYLGFCGAELFGCAHYGSYRTAAACFQIFCFKF